MPDRPNDKKWAERFKRCERIAWRLKTGLQMLIGVSIVALLAAKLGLHAWVPPYVPELWDWLQKTPSLEIVGAALAISAAIELAYMLFTPGPDEAVEPLITGISATVLIVISREDQWHYEGIALIVALTASAGFLFWVREQFIVGAHARHRSVRDEGAAEPRGR